MCARADHVRMVVPVQMKKMDIPAHVLQGGQDLTVNQVRQLLCIRSSCTYSRNAFSDGGKLIAQHLLTDRLPGLGASSKG